MFLSSEETSGTVSSPRPLCLDLPVWILKNCWNVPGPRFGPWLFYFVLGHLVNVTVRSSCRVGNLRCTYRDCLRQSRVLNVALVSVVGWPSPTSKRRKEPVDIGAGSWSVAELAAHMSLQMPSNMVVVLYLRISCRQRLHLYTSIGRLLGRSRCPSPEAVLWEASIGS